MAVTRTDFLDNYPAFANAPTTLIDTTLEFQETRVNRAAFSDDLVADRVVMLETARSLSLEPQAMAMGLAKDSAATKYDKEIEIIRATAGAAKGVF